MGLQSVRVPDPGHGGQTAPLRFRHRPGAPVGPVGRGRVQGRFDNRPNLFRRKTLGTGTVRGILRETGRPSSDKPLSPEEGPSDARFPADWR